MARKKLGKPSLYLTKMNVDQLLNIDARKFIGMKEADIRYIASRVARRVNARLRAIESKPYGRLTPAYSEMTEGQIEGLSIEPSKHKKGKQARLSVSKIKTIKGVKETFYKSRQFLFSKTSTLSGIEDYEAEFSTRVGKRLNPRETKRFWKIYRIIATKYPDLISPKRGKTTNEAQKLIADYWNIYSKPIVNPETGKRRYRTANQVADDLENLILERFGGEARYEGTRSTKSIVHNNE